MLIAGTVQWALLAGAPLSAKEWDPRLMDSSRLAYAGNISQAEEIVGKYLVEHPEDPNGYLIQSVVWEWQAPLRGENLEAANRRILDLLKKANLLAFHRWEKDPKNTDRLIDLGISYLYLGRKHSDLGSWFSAVLTAKKCQRHLEQAIAKDPNRPEASFALGTFHYLADNTPSGAAPFKKLLGIRGTKQQGLGELKQSLQPNHPYFYDARYVWLHLQMEYEKNYPEASRALAELQREFPENPEIQYQQVILARKADPTGAGTAALAFAKWCESKGTACHPNYLFLAYFDAARFNFNGGQNLQAREFFQKALANDSRLNPALTAQAIHTLGLIAKSEGNPLLALEKFREARDFKKLPKWLKKDIERNLNEVCKTPEASGKC